MKKILKKEVIIAFIIGIILASSIAVYATYTYSSKDVGYTKPGETQEISVEAALNDLYKKTKIDYAIEGNAYVLAGITSYGTDSSGMIAMASSSNENYFTVSSANVNYVDITIVKDMHIKILLRSMARGVDFNNTIAVNNETKRTYTNNDYENSIMEYEQDVSKDDIVRITQETKTGGPRCLSIIALGTDK